MARRFDRQAATADARIERLSERVEAARDEGPDRGDGVVVDYTVSPADLAQLHVTDEDTPLPDGDGPAHAPVDGDDVVDALAEVFNARDLDGILDLCDATCEVPGLASDLREVDPALGDLWVRRPTVTMTRMVVDDRAVGVLWERVAAERWGTIGTVHVELDDELVAVMEFSDDIGMLDRCQPPPPDLYDPIWQDPDELVDP